MMRSHVPALSTTTCTSSIAGDPTLLSSWQARAFSQYGADGVLHRLFDDIGVETQYYVEFGTQNGTQCNTRRLRELCGWRGLLMDGGFDRPEIGLHREFITRENIAGLLAKYKVPEAFDLLSVDIDGNDYHVLKAILEHDYAPRVVVVETNFHTLSPASILKYSSRHRWDGTCYGSASVAAFERMLGRHGYTHVATLPPDTYWVKNTVSAPRYVVPNISDDACEGAFTERGRHYDASYKSARREAASTPAMASEVATPEGADGRLNASAHTSGSNTSGFSNVLATAAPTTAGATISHPESTYP